jgi:hypothetical protein
MKMLELPVDQLHMIIVRIGKFYFYELLKTKEHNDLTKLNYLS